MAVFSWLTRKLSNEHEKLLYQNGSAARVLQEIFEDRGDMTTVARLQELEKENRRIALSAEEGHIVSPDDVEILLNMNKELRRFFDQTATRYVDTFDNFYKPPLGWEATSQRQSDRSSRSNPSQLRTVKKKRHQPPRINSVEEMITGLAACGNLSTEEQFRLGLAIEDVRTGQISAKDFQFLQSLYRRYIQA